MSDMEKKLDEEVTALSADGLEEDVARADLYGLLAALFFQAPDDDLLHRIAASAAYGTGSEAPDNAALTQAWNELVRVASSSKAQEWADEHQELFIGIGKPEVFLYGSYYQSGFLNEKPLVRLRDSLQELGLEASENITESEDHIASLCEVMRYLIAGDDLAIANLTQQKKFFDEHMRSWVQELCDATEVHPLANHYKSVAMLAKAFFEVEAYAMDMVE
jgi:TorA maturation chaperone TorD